MSCDIEVTNESVRWWEKLSSYMKIFKIDLKAILVVSLRIGVEYSSEISGGSRAHELLVGTRNTGTQYLHR